MKKTQVTKFMTRVKPLSDFTKGVLRGKYIQIRGEGNVYHIT